MQENCSWIHVYKSFVFVSPVNILPTRLVAMALNATNFTANTTGGAWNGSDPGSDTFAEDHGSEVDVLIKVVLTSLSCIVFFYVCWRNSRMHWLDGEDLVEEGIEGEQEDPEARLKRYQQQLACHSVILEESHFVKTSGGEKCCSAPRRMLARLKGSDCSGSDEEKGDVEVPNMRNNASDRSMDSNKSKSSSHNNNNNSSSNDDSSSSSGTRDDSETFVAMEGGRLVPTTCTICLNNYRVGDTIVWSTSCSHVFHMSCMESWLMKYPGKPHCPYCRGDFLSTRKLSLHK